MPVKMEVKGDYKKTRKFLSKMEKQAFYKELSSFAQRGVDLLSQATPKRTGRTSSMWEYDITIEKDRATIEWHNNNVNKGVPIAIILQYGHGTGTGGYVTGIDYINPVTELVFEQAVNKIWSEVVNS